MSKKSTLKKKPSVLKPRDIKTIDEEYARQCGELGQDHYNKTVLEARIAQRVQRIHELKTEAVAAQQMEASQDKPEIVAEDAIEVETESETAHA